MQRKIIYPGTSRRKFLKKAGTGIAALAIASRYSLAGEQGATRKIRIGIVWWKFWNKFLFP